jgi:hypothetical protein
MASSGTTPAPLAEKDEVLGPDRHEEGRRYAIAGCDQVHQQIEVVEHAASGPGVGVAVHQDRESVELVRVQGLVPVDEEVREPLQHGFGAELDDVLLLQVRFRQLADDAVVENPVRGYRLEVELLRGCPGEICPVVARRKIDTRRDRPRHPVELADPRAVLDPRDLEHLPLDREPGKALERGIQGDSVLHDRVVDGVTREERLVGVPSLTAAATPDRAGACVVENAARPSTASPAGRPSAGHH